MIKENEIDELSVSLNGSRIAQLLANQWAELSIQKETVANQSVDPTNLNEVVKTTKKEEVDTFFIQNNTQWNKNSAPGRQHACDDSIP